MVFGAHERMLAMDGDYIYVRVCRLSSKHRFVPAFLSFFDQTSPLAEESWDKVTPLTLLIPRRERRYSCCAAIYYFSCGFSLTRFLIGSTDHPINDESFTGQPED